MLGLTYTLVCSSQIHVSFKTVELNMVHILSFINDMC